MWSHHVRRLVGWWNHLQSWGETDLERDDREVGISNSILDVFLLRYLWDVQVGMLGTLVDIQIGYPLSMWEPYCSKDCELNEIMQGERTRERERGQEGTTKGTAREWCPAAKRGDVWTEGIGAVEAIKMRAEEHHWNVQVNLWVNHCLLRVKRRPAHQGALLSSSGLG